MGIIKTSLVFIGGMVAGGYCITNTLEGERRTRPFITTGTTSSGTVMGVYGEATT